MRLRWIDTTQGTAHGYATVAKEMRQTLATAGAAFGVDGTPDLLVGIGLPGAYENERHSPALVWHTMLEVDILPPGWVEWLNRAGLVWTPSAWVQDLFQRNGVIAPIMVCGYGIDPAVFHPNDRLAPGNRPMRFGVWSDALRTRKHPELAVAAWLAADVPDANLEVHLTDTTAAPFWVDSNGNELHHVRVTRGAWPQGKLADWLRSLDCLIYLSGGEGFGLMPFEAMACGTPVVCAYNTGMTDYLTDANAVLVRRHSSEPAWTYTARFGPNYLPQQLLPDFDEAVAAIRWASDNRDGALRDRGGQAAKDIAPRTWAAIGRNAYGLLVNHKVTAQ